MRIPALACLLCTLAVSTAQTPAPADDFHSNPKFQKAVDAAKQPHMTTQDRYSAWQKANKIADGKCAECLEKMLTYDQSLQDWKDMAKSGYALQQIATTPKQKFEALLYQGNGMMHFNSDKPKKGDLEAASDALSGALKISPDDLGANYQLGRAYAMLGRDDDAKSTFHHYLEVSTDRDAYRTRVSHFAENPHLATMPMAPAFTIHTTDGQEFSLDSLTGKVVLLDFWASWCGPCRETLPRIRSIAQKFQGQPLVILSISIDSKEDAWQKAMKEEAMTWPQYRDADGKLANAYGAHSIPRFFTIDSDGALQDVQVGSDASIEGELKKLVKRATAAQTATQPRAAGQ